MSRGARSYMMALLRWVGVQVFHQLEGEVFARVQYSETGLQALPHLGRIGAQEEGASSRSLRLPTR